ncbi:MAG: 1-acyl-sn-glycerol-3-phosphate acyltransferase [Clostridia bacterium]|nr:1-acyl-sn-glycerol-3-phosphate acyltransferase [Clostridia bacterium]
MKIKTKKMPYSKVVTLKKPKHKKPVKPNILFRTIVRIASVPDLLKVKFRYEGKLPSKMPCLILMNHSSFIDLEIVSKIMYPRPYGIVTTSDGLVGKRWLMRRIGCIPTQKFVNDISLIKDINYLLKEKKTSVLMYPEASYSFDGTATPLPEKLGRLLKMLNVPVVMITTEGAFSRDPLYNCLQKRKTKVKANVKCLLTPEEINEMSVSRLDAVLKDAFSFDHFKWQRENKIKIKEPFRADGLERILYKCPNCLAEGKTKGEGISLKCSACGKEYVLDEYGVLKATKGNTEFSHIPAWYLWEREKVKEDIENGAYSLDTPVDIGMSVDYKAIYMVGEGRLTHTKDGFVLTGCNGELEYKQKPLFNYSLYADYYWYEIGDVICIGDKNALYYCFPKTGVPVAKARLAVEEMYKSEKAKARS